MNTYRYSFTAKCPTDGDSVYYRLVILSPSMIRAESIRAICDVEQAFHEEMADRLAKLGGEQVMVATHRGVEIETKRP